VQKRSLRWQEGVCVIEGPDLIEAALDAGVAFEALFVDETSVADAAVVALSTRAAALHVRTYCLEAGVLERVADTQTPQPVLASVRFSVRELSDVPTTGLVVVLDNVRDPGNAGTIIRSADAAGAAAVVFTGDCVDPFNPKTLRASAGSVFHVVLALSTLRDATAFFTAHAMRSYATVVRGGTPYRDVDLSGACAVVIGNEAAGLDSEAVTLCDEMVSIEMAGRSESLNAGVAASLIAFEALHQRRATTDG
jgi:TrmH family RNA methyltransferase